MHRRQLLVAGGSLLALSACASNGMESNPHENTIRAPDAFALASYFAIICAIHAGSPQRST